jgi:hypothetical protein
MPNSSPYWFPAKRYGWGWGPPATWQGWVVLVVWLVATAGGGIYIHASYPIWFGAYNVAMVALLLLILYVKGEPPRWRWGGRGE